VAKKLSDIEIEKEVNSSHETFLAYLRKNLNPEAYTALHNLSSGCSLYIFSGVIRNFFLNISEPIRDLDIIVDCDCEIHNVFRGYDIKRNSFGGYKIDVNGFNIDLWCIKDTWMYRFQRVLEFDSSLFLDIPNTAFFNFSSILFDLKNKTFIYKKDFIRFLRNKELDVVNEINPNYELCIVNSLYYSDKYKLTIGDNLKRLIIARHFDITDYSSAQEKHFGRVLYPNHEIKSRIQTLWKNSPSF
jgi:hypothetical protein